MSSAVKIPRRNFLKGSLAAIAAATMFSKEALAGAEAKRQPNFVLINCDDLGYGDLGCYGSELIATPNIDALAKGGTRLTDFYSCAAVCTPSRAGLMTGRYPLRSGLTRVLLPNDTIGITNEVTVAEILKQRGYSTACIGKWHLGCLPKHLPTSHGFDYFYGLPYSNDMQKEHRKDPPIPLMRGNEIIEAPVVQETLTERYTEEAIKFIKNNKKRPFFVYLPHTMPHVPLHVSERFKGRSKRGLYGDVVETIDWSLGEIMKTLKELGLEENTLVMFTSDNGPWLQKKEDGGSAGPLRAGKGTQYEGGMREPFIAYWPGHVPAGRVCVEPASNLDILPILSTLAGGKVPADRIIDGRNITPILTDASDMPDYPFFYMGGPSIAAVRYGRWKMRIAKNDEGKFQHELYDLKADIGETKNIAAENPKLIEKLKPLVDEFRKTLPGK
ncbi:MAG: sulfatase-like hydrolase/transferase [Armatimonadota bacterium]|nr:sulfatase-like hydrolase/transferase [Armatimonadota bacterium]